MVTPTTLGTGTTEHTRLGRVQYWLAVVFVVGWTGVVCGGLAVQFGTWDYPCPLCMVQRNFMTLAALGGAYIVAKGLRGTITRRDYMTGWGLAIVGCFGGGFAAWRQTMLHILPGDPGYGGTVLGLHLYVWALILFVAAIATIGVVLSFAHATAGETIPTGGVAARIGRLALWFCGLVIVINLVAVFLLEGLHWFLPDNPSCYQFFHDIGVIDGTCPVIE
ncbi:disulfide bond formation protein B [Nocardia otitidiscaviarum]|uniref:Disulfide bond formation protein B n=1 Tax=Nocardia otitidiscaviarum TaxID=1823 RepID=A0A378YG29_9NOCA|nr:disulfide bond formation protein B [Nocardia otitidiscaviarum]MBF6179388.1 disulfide bond formation protein B [Nocardia otitidiscaviarum]MBF6236014.1 disulfide bond formation protein B [Nocardia otitidiscaviarum]MCP9621258.1 disulfide bond formation protein B [Nocardia otitidiscaviarum]QDP81992.1 disulfide bond formation protein B [Nocardia otitidiscaviarum]SUA76126.1 disulfide bond formation protein B [Nocardia otitidiscaviarum]